MLRPLTIALTAFATPATAQLARDSTYHEMDERRRRAARPRN